jgi:hypothetical protein
VRDDIRNSAAPKDAALKAAALHLNLYRDSADSMPEVEGYDLVRAVQLRFRLDLRGILKRRHTKKLNA